MDHRSGKQFVIQQHTTPDGLHWDLMLEMDDCLWTWRLDVPPSQIKNKPIPAERIHDHPLRFLAYEGPVKNNTGHVTIIDKGTGLISSQNPTMLVIMFRGKILSGTFQLGLLKNHRLWRLERI
jgi:hypothetical protein